MIIYDFFSVFYLMLMHFSILYSHGKTFWSFVYVIIYCVGEGISTLISISDCSNPYIFCQKMEKTRSVKEEMEGKLFISRQSRHISFVVIMIKVLFTTLYLYLASKQLNCPPRKRYKQEKCKYEGDVFNITLIVSWLYWLRLVIFSKESHFCYNLKWINK